MKKSLLVIILLAFVSFQLNAGTVAGKKKRSHKKQTSELRFGPRLGLNLANMAIKESSPAPKSIMGFQIGGMVEYSLNDLFSLEGGLLYSGKGCKMDYDLELSMPGLSYKVTGDLKVKPAYLEIPINAVLKLELGDNKVFFFGGPYFGFGIGGKIKGDYTLETNMPGVTLASLGMENSNESIKFGSSETDDMKGMDIGLNFGAGFEIMNFQIRAQYGLGLSNLSTIDAGDMKNRVLGISFGYMLGN